MKIAVGTDDKKTIRHGHFGESQYYLIYEILNGEIFSNQIRENPYTANKSHEHGQATKIVELLHDCQIFMGRSMGARSLRQIAEKNIEVIITTINDADEAVNFYLDSKDEYFRYYNLEKKKFCECSSR